MTVLQQSITSLALIKLPTKNSLFAQNCAIAAEANPLGVCYIGGIRNDIKQVDELLKSWPEFQGKLIDIREESERKRDGVIPGSLHLPYGQFSSYCAQSGPLQLLGKDAQLLLYCAVGERSTLAVEIAAEHGIKNIAHVPGGFREWKTFGGAVEEVG